MHYNKLNSDKPNVRLVLGFAIPVCERKEGGGGCLKRFAYSLCREIGKVKTAALLREFLPFCRGERRSLIQLQ